MRCPTGLYALIFSFLFLLNNNVSGRSLLYSGSKLFFSLNDPQTIVRQSAIVIKKSTIPFSRSILKNKKTLQCSRHSLFAQANTLDSENTAKTSSQEIESGQHKTITKNKTALSQYTKYVQIKVGVTRILDTISPNSPVLGLASKGSHFPLIKAGERWCAIAYEDRRGWVALNDINIVDSPSSSKIVVREFFIIFLITISIILLIVIFYFFSGRKNKIKAEWFTTAKKKMKIVIIAKKETQVQRLLTNNRTSLEKCFSEIGFEVKKSSDSDTAKKLIYHYLPDAIVVDWQIGRNTPIVMEHILTSKSLTNNIFVLYYNLPDPDKVQKSKAIPNSHYLGISFTDRELFKVITPLIITGEKKHTIRKSIEASALQGDIADCNLSEVFQFVEIGAKTGCLLIEDNEPCGIIYFNNGIIIYVASKHHTAKKAVFNILNLESGQFYFVHGRKPKSANCSIDSRSILFEWAKVTDETSWDRLRQT